ncbi:cytochrome c5 family protein [Aeromonas jandaei]|uniref:Cytochrome c5 family protein n=1 Tax=Aeromonas jandaei TaxID=650 RepID=A0ABD7EII5_AERJA|nr:MULTISPECIES: c-type cytochrome [Aeromonas]MBL0546975.1 cytochrome c5 family protein [Aeromonas jandaei]MBL0599692.1 cytochrome c5 family protein [Aeromonas jandaei]MBL0611597.1 cytochrome c5 family protein [Aeromonas jandaei]MBM0492739.1 cytochrome c5 family protein [Aeromonas jandaei]QTL96281.1 Cytochrome c-555 precursor [Aeromonas jandaei]
MSVLKKLSYLLAVGMTAVSLSGAVFAADDMSPDAIAERIKPVGQVYTAKDLEGIAGAGAAPAAAASSGPRDGETVFKGACFACHDTGAAGAPKRGDKAAWEPRIAQGIETLKKHAIGGFTGKSGMMPPRGTCATCSDEEIENAIHYMIDKL